MLIVYIYWKPLKYRYIVVLSCIETYEMHCHYFVKGCLRQLKITKILIMKFSVLYQYIFSVFNI